MNLFKSLQDKMSTYALHVLNTIIVLKMRSLSVN